MSATNRNDFLNDDNQHDLLTQLQELNQYDLSFRFLTEILEDKQIRLSDNERAFIVEVVDQSHNKGFGKKVDKTNITQNIKGLINIKGRLSQLLADNSSITPYQSEISHCIESIEKHQALFEALQTIELTNQDLRSLTQDDREDIIANAIHARRYFGDDSELGLALLKVLDKLNASVGESIMGIFTDFNNSEDLNNITPANTFDLTPVIDIPKEEVNETTAESTAADTAPLESFLKDILNLPKISFIESYNELATGKTTATKEETIAIKNEHDLFSRLDVSSEAKFLESLKQQDQGASFSFKDPSDLPNLRSHLRVHEKISQHVAEMHKAIEGKVARGGEVTIDFYVEMLRDVTQKLSKIEKEKILSQLESSAAYFGDCGPIGLYLQNLHDAMDYLINVENVESKRTSIPVLDPDPNIKQAAIVVTKKLATNARAVAAVVDSIREMSEAAAVSVNLYPNYSEGIIFSKLTKYALAGDEENFKRLSDRIRYLSEDRSEFFSRMMGIGSSDVKSISALKHFVSSLKDKDFDVIKSAFRETSAVSYDQFIKDLKESNIDNNIKSAFEANDKRVFERADVNTRNPIRIVDKNVVLDSSAIIALYKQAKENHLEEKLYNNDSSGQSLFEHLDQLLASRLTNLNLRKNHDKIDHALSNWNPEIREESLKKEALYVAHRIQLCLPVVRDIDNYVKSKGLMRKYYFKKILKRLGNTEQSGVDVLALITGRKDTDELIARLRKSYVSEYNTRIKEVVAHEQCIDGQLKIISGNEPMRSKLKEESRAIKSLQSALEEGCNEKLAFDTHVSNTANSGQSTRDKNIVLLISARNGLIAGTKKATKLQKMQEGDRSWMSSVFKGIINAFAKAVKKDYQGYVGTSSFWKKAHAYDNYSACKKLDKKFGISVR